MPWRCAPHTIELVFIQEMQMRKRAPRVSGFSERVSYASVERVGSPRSDSLVRWLPRSRGPEFPRELLSLRQGSVVARFVVDTSGRVITGTAIIISESDRGFGRSVCQFLEHQARFDVRPVEGKQARTEVRNAPFLFQMGQ